MCFCRFTKTNNSQTIIALKVYNHLLHLIRKYEQNLFLNKYCVWLLENIFTNLFDSIRSQVRFGKVKGCDYLAIRQMPFEIQVDEKTHFLSVLVIEN